MLRLSALGALILVSSELLAQQYTISTIAGTGAAGSTGNGTPAISASVYYPQGLALAADGSLYFGQPADHTVRMIDAVSGNMEHVAGIGTVGYNGNGGLATDAGLAYPFGLSFNAAGDLFIAERDAFRIRMISAMDGTISTYAGTLSPGNNTEVPALSANLHAPMGVRMRSNGDLLLSVIGNNYVRYIDGDSMYLHAFAGIGSAVYSGDNGAAISAGLNQPYDIAEASNGDIYICDVNNAAIRKVEAISGNITTVAGLGAGAAAYNGDGIPATQAALGLPFCIALDADDNLYISDAQQSRIRRVDANSGLISTIAGTNTSGYNGDNIPANAAQINAPCGMVIDAQGRILFADAANHRIRMLTPVDDTGVDGTIGRKPLSAFPSPTSDLLHVRSEAQGKVELVDAQGKTVLVGDLRTGRTALTVDGLPSGLYTVRMAGAVPARVVVH